MARVDLRGITLRVTILGLVVAVLPTQVPAAAEARPPSKQPPSCDAVDFAPDIEKTPVAFCARAIWGETGVTSFAVYLSRDGGRGWSEASAAGLTVSSASDQVRDLIVSPRYDVDQTVYVQTVGGLFASTDEGETFSLVDPLAGGLLASFVSDGSLLSGGSSVAFAMARGDQSALVEPPLHVPVAGSPGNERRFLVPGDFATSGEAFVLSSVEEGPGLFHTSVYRCNAVLACAEELFAFPSGDTYQSDAYLAPDFTSSRRMYVFTEDLTDRPYLDRKAWVSDDGGETFRRWKSVEKIFDASTTKFGRYGTGVTAAKLAVNPKRPKKVFLHVETTSRSRPQASPPAPPTFQLFVSHNRGETFKRIGHSLLFNQKGRAGNLPWNTVVSDFDLESDGRLVVLSGKLRMDDFDKTYYGIFCSQDGGRRWTRGCR